MDKDNIRRIINQIISEANLGNVEIFFEDDSVLRLEVISNKFKGIRLLKRIDILSELFIDLAMSDFSDFQLIFNPLTVNEKQNGKSELSETSTHDDTNSGFAAESFY